MRVTVLGIGFYLRLWNWEGRGLLPFHVSFCITILISRSVYLKSVFISTLSRQFNNKLFRKQFAVVCCSRIECIYSIKDHSLDKNIQWLMTNFRKLLLQRHCYQSWPSLWVPCNQKRSKFYRFQELPAVIMIRQQLPILFYILFNSPSPPPPLHT